MRDLSRPSERLGNVLTAQAAAPLSLAALPLDTRRTTVDEFVESSTRRDPFFVREALRFLDFLVARHSGVPHLPEVAAFERATLVLSESLALGAPVPPAPDLPATVVRNPLASVIAFAAPPDEIFAALVADRPLPDARSAEHWLLVAPNLPGLARPASAFEAWVFEEAQQPVRPFNHAAVRGLWRSGALVAAG